MKYNLVIHSDEQVLKNSITTAEGSCFNILNMLLTIKLSDSLYEYATSSAFTEVFTERELRLLRESELGHGVASCTKTLGLSRPRVRQIQSKVRHKLIKVVGRVSEIYSLQNSIAELSGEHEGGEIFNYLKGVDLLSFDCGVNITIGGVDNLSDLLLTNKSRILQIRRVGPISYGKFWSSVSTFSKKLRAGDSLEQAVSIELTSWLKANKQ